MEYTKKQIKEAYQALPEDIKSIMSSLETAETVETIGLKHKLHYDKIGNLAFEISLLMMGLVKPQDFTLRLEQKLLIPSSLAVAITIDVNDKIFSKIQGKLKEITERRQPGDSEKTESSDNNSTQTTNLFEKRLGNVVSQPKEEIKLRVDDPYREPIN